MNPAERMVGEPPPCDAVPPKTVRSWRPPSVVSARLSLGADGHNKAVVADNPAMPSPFENGPVGTSDQVRPSSVECAALASMPVGHDSQRTAPPSSAG